jgi:hypothetical protein
MGFRQLETIHEIEEGPQHNSHLQLHVGPKLLHPSAHVHFMYNINLSLESWTYNLIAETRESNNKQ